MLQGCENLILAAKGETSSKSRLDISTIRFNLILGVNLLGLKPWDVFYNILTPVLSMAWRREGMVMLRINNSLVSFYLLFSLKL